MIVYIIHRLNGCDPFYYNVILWQISVSLNMIKVNINQNYCANNNSTIITILEGIA